MVLFLFFDRVIIIRNGTSNGTFSRKTMVERAPYTAFAFVELHAQGENVRRKKYSPIYRILLWPSAIQ